MLRHLLLSVVLGTTLSFAGGGCRSCSSCHDYDGPVADCNNCGCGRTGSASHCGACSPCDGAPCNCAGGACGPGGVTSGCNCGNQAPVPNDEYYDATPDDNASNVPQSQAQPQ